MITVACFTSFTGHSASTGSAAGAGGGSSMSSLMAMTAGGEGLSREAIGDRSGPLMRVRSIHEYGGVTPYLLGVTGVILRAAAGSEEVRVAITRQSDRIPSIRYYTFPNSEGSEVTFCHAKYTPKDHDIEFDIIAMPNLGIEKFETKFAKLDKTTPGLSTIVSKYCPEAAAQTQLVNSFRRLMETINFKDILPGRGNVIFTGMGTGAFLSLLMGVEALGTSGKLSTVSIVCGATLKAGNEPFATFITKNLSFLNIYPATMSGLALQEKMPSIPLILGREIICTKRELGLSDEKSLTIIELIKAFSTKAEIILRK